MFIYLRKCLLMATACTSRNNNFFVSNFRREKNLLVTGNKSRPCCTINEYIIEKWLLSSEANKAIMRKLE
jgi:hypothetical protein